MTATDHYLIFGLALSVHCERGATRDAIRRRLSPYRWSPTGDVAPVDLVIGRSGPILDATRHGRPVYDSPVADVSYDDRADCLTVDGGDKVQMVAQLDRGRGPVQMSVLSDDDVAWAMCAHPLLTLCVLELMKRRGRYSLHAGGVVVGGGAVLLPGTSGSGKSTLTAALLDAGADFLSDDMVFLEPDGQGIQVLAFADELDVTDATAAMFPELADLVGAPPQPGRPKHQVRAEDRFGRDRVDRARAVALVLPTVVDETESSLREAEANELLARLAPNVLLTDAGSSQRHLDALAALVESVPAYHLSMGRDPAAAARTVLAALS